MPKVVLMNKFARALRRNLSEARQQEEDTAHMRVLTDQAGHKVATKLYHQYISDADYSKLPAFVQDLDRMLAKYGAATGKGDSEDDEDTSQRPQKSDDDDEQQDAKREKF